MKSKKSKKKINGGDIIKNLFGGKMIFGGFDMNTVGIFVIAIIALLFIGVILNCIIFYYVYTMPKMQNLDEDNIKSIKDEISKIVENLDEDNIKSIKDEISKIGKKKFNIKSIKDEISKIVEKKFTNVEDYFTNIKEVNTELEALLDAFDVRVDLLLGDVEEKVNNIKPLDEDKLSDIIQKQFTENCDKYITNHTAASQTNLAAEPQAQWTKVNGPTSAPTTNLAAAPQALWTKVNGPTSAPTALRDVS